MLVVAGCDRGEKGDAPAVASTPAPAPSATATAACKSLADAFCERTPITCEAAGSMMVGAQLSDDACNTAREQLVATDALSPDMRGRAQAEVLATLMKTSPVVSPADVDALLAEANASAAAGAKDPGEAMCPGVATKKGTPPPGGDEVWCEKADGKRHGPASKWNAAGELVRTVEYRHGAIESVEYTKPASGDLPMALFVCPDGEALEEDKYEALDIRFCEKDGQRGAVGFWKAGKLHEIESTPRTGGPAENRFVGYMNQPE
jgi:hypothetical protein